MYAVPLWRLPDISIISPPVPTQPLRESPAGAGFRCERKQSHTASRLLQEWHSAAGRPSVANRPRSSKNDETAPRYPGASKAQDQPFSPNDRVEASSPAARPNICAKLANSNKPSGNFTATYEEPAACNAVPRLQIDEARTGKRARSLPTIPVRGRTSDKRSLCSST